MFSELVIRALYCANLRRETRFQTRRRKAGVFLIECVGGENETINGSVTKKCGHQSLTLF